MLGAAQAMVVTQEKQSYESVASDGELRTHIDVRFTSCVLLMACIVLSFARAQSLARKQA